MLQIQSGKLAVATFAGFLICLGVLYADGFSGWGWVGWPEDDPRHYVLGVQKGHLWVFLVCIQSTTWAIAYFALGCPDTLGTNWNERWTTAKSNLGVLAAVVAALFAVPFAVALQSDDSFDVPNHGRKMIVFLVLATPAVVLVSVEMLRVKDRFTHMRATELTKSADHSQFMALRDYMNQLLILMGSMLSALALGTGAFRNAYNSIPDAIWFTCDVLNPARNITMEGVLVYCGFHSLPILLCFAPAYGAFADAGQRVVDTLVPIDESTPQNLTKSLRNRAEVEKVLQLDKNATDRLKNGILILSPVLSGAVSLLLSAK